MRRPISAAAAMLCLALILGASASAAPPHKLVHHRASFSFEAHLPSADGYALYLRAKNHRDIELDVEREAFTEPYVTMTYRAKGRVGEDGIKVDFGRFGRVDLRFGGSAQVERFHPPNCRPAVAEITRGGVLRGRFEFESLDGTVKLSTGRVEGGISDDPAQTCRPRPREEFEGPPSFASRRPTVAEGTEEEGFATGFSALAHTGRRTIEIYAVSLHHEVIPDMAATSTRRYGRVLVSTSVHAPETEEEKPGEAVRFSISGKGTRPHRATLSAPLPFSGIGTYSYRPGSPATFLGSLKVRIPGEGTLSLAGPEFKAALCNFAKARRQRACEETATPPHTV
jgi:hypothetical protein